jgi:RsiW-degrading membrane proteinase PrsW (M82 family)
MNIYAAIALCFVPYIFVFLLFHFAVHVKIMTELWSSLLGLLAVVPITFIQFYIAGIPFFNSGRWSSELFKAILFNGLIEELLKMAVLFLIPSKKLTLGRFFACALLCGLSLGCFESVIYFLQHLQSANSRGAVLLYEQIFIRMFTTDILHMFCAGLAGLFVWSVKQHKTDVMAIIYPVIIHGLYNFFALFDEYRWFALAAILFAAVQCRIRYVNMKEDKPPVLHRRRISQKKSVSDKKTQKTVIKK